MFTDKELLPHDRPDLPTGSGARAVGKPAAPPERNNAATTDTWRRIQRKDRIAGMVAFFILICIPAAIHEGQPVIPTKNIFELIGWILGLAVMGGLLSIPIGIIRRTLVRYIIRR